MLSAIYFQLRGKSELILLCDINFTPNTISIPSRTYQILHQNRESYSEKMMSFPKHLSVIIQNSLWCDLGFVTYGGCLCVCACDAVHQPVRCVQIMRWWSSNL